MTLASINKALLILAGISLLFWISMYIMGVFDLFRPYLHGIESEIRKYYSTEQQLKQCHNRLGIRSTLQNWAEIRQNCVDNGTAEDLHLESKVPVELGTHMIFVSATEMRFSVRRKDRWFSEVWTVGKLGLVRAKVSMLKGGRSK